MKPTKKPYELGWILREVSGIGYTVDDPIEGSIFTILLSSADVWASKEEAERAGKQRGYTCVIPVQVRLKPDRVRATAMDFVLPKKEQS